MTCSLLLLLLQAPSVAAQDPSMPVAEPATLAFEDALHTGLREGHVSLSWNRVEEVQEYRLTDDRGVVVYRGEFERAFVSGLPDGTHTFFLQAFDADGQLLASSESPAVVEVQHWPLQYALASFLVGLIVVVALIAVIITGAFRTRAGDVSDVLHSASEGSG